MACEIKAKAIGRFGREGNYMVNQEDDAHFYGYFSKSSTSFFVLKYDHIRASRFSLKTLWNWVSNAMSSWSFGESS